MSKKSNLIRRVYNKFYIRPKYIKNHKNSFISLLKFLDFYFDDYLEISKEIIADKNFNDSINSEMEKTGLKKIFPLDEISWPYFIYYLLRKKKPEIVIETGVWYGVSTSVILSALNKNDKGTLYSIDLPAYFDSGGYTDENPYLSEEERTASLPPGKEPGFIVPEDLKSRWKLILGDTKTYLPKLFDELKNVDLFLHDSLHSYENMTFEYNLALNYVKKGGYIMSDNIDWHSAFYDICNSKDLKCKTYLAYFESPKLKNNFGLISL